MPLVMGISDRVDCLEAGAVIAEGTPGEVRDDPLVIASYLGTDGRLSNTGDPARAATAPAGDRRSRNSLTRSRPTGATSFSKSDRKLVTPAQS